MLICRFIFTLVLLFFFSTPAASIVVLQGDHTDFGQKYFAGFSSVVKNKVSAYKYSPESESSLIQKINSIRPDLIMTIGAVPLEKLIKRFSATPVIAADYYDSSLKSKANLIMLDQTQPIEHAFDIVQSIFNRPITWGLIYDPKYSQADYDTIKILAKQKGIKVLAIKADKIIDIKSALPAFKNKIQAFMQLKDITVNHPNASEAIGSFCKSNGIALISLNPHSSENYTPLFSASVDPIALGEKAHSLAETIISSNTIPSNINNNHSHGDYKQIVSTISLEQLSLMGLKNDDILSLLNQITNKNIRIVLVR